MKNVVKGIPMPPDMIEAIQEIAKKENRSFAAQVRQAISEMIEARNG